MIPPNFPGAWKANPELCHAIANPLDKIPTKILHTKIQVESPIFHEAAQLYMASSH